MMPVPDDAKAGTGNRHLRRLKGRVVRRGERAIGGEPGNPRVVKVSFDNSPKVVKLPLAGRVRLDAV